MLSIPVTAVVSKLCCDVGILPWHLANYGSSFVHLCLVNFLVFRLLSQAVGDEVCRTMKNLIDARAKTRKLVPVSVTPITTILTTFLLPVAF